MDNKKYLYGASGHCKVIIDILKSNNYTVEAVFDDAPSADYLLGIPVVSTKNSIDFSKKKMLISIGDNAIRKKIAEALGTAFYSALHPKAILSQYASIDVGCVIMAGAVLNAESHIGKHCIINTGAVVEHDCLIADYVHLSPNVSLAGNVSVGQGSHIGIGATVIQGIKIGKWSVIGAGAVIIKDVPDYAVVVGNPGKIIKFNIK
ncbi:sugar O-acyltransferase, sialic acid O-acetyltransferase NeuD family [Flavobacterium omnivorum]|uniref:Sugar O-acyltransferase, sialic acid O-acetyltransferase NeuD family n=1 Tax=Flavobacterium omnivorum TaxID=178355 RepID=A0A1G8DTZ6_9FLAO|nr:acetyltransferase [Flavobacterium omnivorum]SDH61176.1 sugar O-acyltransferase, sialic acid O-acetyltransferase NeuD family [Flavobacterium omnivorum]